MNLFKEIKYINLVKISNLIKLQRTFFKFKKNSFSQDTRTIPPPSFISFEPTNYCNLKCPACPSGSGKLTRPKGYANLDFFKKIIDENKKHLINLVLHFQGEPLMHKHLNEMIAYAHKNNVRTEFSTNANLLAENISKITEAKPDKIIISLDGISQKTYNKYRVNGDINKVYNSLERISKIQKNIRPKIELQFLVFSHNEHEIPTLQKIKHKYKIDKLVLKTAQVYGKEQADLIPKNQKHSRYVFNKDGIPVLKSKLPNYCKRIIFGSVITWDGKLVPCCFDKDATFVMGNTKKSRIAEIRNQNNYKKFVKSVFSQRNKIKMCQNCTEA